MSLEAFLNKFNNADGKYAYAIDPYKYFNVYIKFNNGGAITGGGNNALGNILNNVTGGLYSRVKNSSKSTLSKNGYPDIPTLINSSLITESAGGTFDITYFTQSGSLPKLTVPNSEDAKTVMGDFTTHKMAVQPDQKSFTLNILNTKTSLVDRVFYPWMRELAYPYWSYKDNPFTTATITISFASHNDISYVFLGSRPTSVEALNPTNTNDTKMERGVTFAFDFMYIESAGKNSESIKDTVANIGKTIVNKAAATIGL